MRNTMKLGTLFGGGPVYVLRDTYSDDAAAGFTSPRQAIKGKLVRAADSLNRGSISGGDFVINGAVSVNYANPAYYYTDDADAGLVRAAGQTVIFKVNGTADIGKFGLATSTTVGNANQFSFVLDFGGLSISYARQGTNIALGAVAASTDYYLAMTLSATGIGFRIKGGLFTNWTPLFVDTLNFATTPIWPAFSAATTPAYHIADFWTAGPSEVGKLTTENGALINQASPDTTILTGSSSGVFQVVSTVPTGGAGKLIELRYRQADANNYLLARIEWNGSAYQFVTGHVIAGVESLQGSPITGLVSAANVARFEVQAYSNSHNFYTTGGSSWTKQYGTITDSNGPSNTGVSVRNVGFTSTTLQVWDGNDSVINALLDRVISA